LGRRLHPMLLIPTPEIRPPENCLRLDWRLDTIAYFRRSVCRVNPGGIRLRTNGGAREECCFSRTIQTAGSITSNAVSTSFDLVAFPVTSYYSIEVRHLSDAPRFLPNVYLRSSHAAACLSVRRQLRDAQTRIASTISTRRSPA